MAFCHSLKTFSSISVVCTDGKWLAGNKISWYPVLLHLTIQFCAIKRRFTVDYLYQKLLILVQICWKYLRISQGSGFFRHSVVYIGLVGTCGSDNVCCDCV